MLQLLITVIVEATTGVRHPGPFYHYAVHMIYRSARIRGAARRVRAIKISTHLTQSLPTLHREKLMQLLARSRPSRCAAGGQ